MALKLLSDLPHPRQPIGLDELGTARFKKNEIVRDLLDAASEGRKLDLNAIVLKHHHGGYSLEDLVQLYRLIGYSVCGFCDLSAVPDSEKDAAEAEAAK